MRDDADYDDDEDDDDDAAAAAAAAADDDNDGPRFVCSGCLFANYARYLFERRETSISYRRLIFQKLNLD